MPILSNEYSKLIVKEVVDGKEKILLEITDVSETPVTSNENIIVQLTPKY
ncbi:hypothetical protein [Sporosarcina psychrophila]|nr:hypothetical protein [Sporosarcina psychrophila]